MSSEEYLPHISVLLEECLQALQTGAKDAASPLLADLTFGAGGHTKALLARMPNAHVVAFDQDPEAIANGKAMLEREGLSTRVTLIHSNFSELATKAQTAGWKFNGVLMDLGVSSHQLDAQNRGFSFRRDAPLDMRMNPSDHHAPTAADLINSLSAEDLADIFWKYGDERLSRRIAGKIVERREEQLFATTGELEDIVFHCYPKASRFSKTHPATRCFQALRIAVNNELGVLENTLPVLPDFLANEGTIAVISFHSLEDRIVKHTFKDLVDKRVNQVKILTKKPLIPSDAEMLANPRARSAKLRVLQKTQNHGGGKYGLKKQKEDEFSEE